MKNKTKKILAGACLGLVGMGCLAGCEKKQDFYELTVINDSQYGIIGPVLDNETNSVTVDRGDNYTFTITPREGYEIKNLLIDGNLVEPNSVYTFTDIKSDHSIGAVYEREARSYTILGMEFWAYFKDSSDYVDQNISGNSKYLKLRISQRDQGTQFLQEQKDIMISEFAEKKINIGKSASQSDFVNHISLVDGTSYQDLKFADETNNPYDSAHISIEYFATEEENYEGDGYHVSPYSQFCKDSDIVKFDSIHADLFKLHLGKDANVEVKTTDGKAIILTNVSLICRANY